MDALPVELVRLILGYCDAASVRSLRGASRVFADVGYEYLISPKFTAVTWRNDIDRLHSIARHPRLRDSVESIEINLSALDEYNARHASMLQHYFQEPEERAQTLRNAWLEFDSLDQRCRNAVKLHTRRDELSEAISLLRNLRDLEISFTKCPVDNPVMKDVYEMPNCRKLDREEACKDLDTIVYALRNSRLSSLAIDRFPLEILRSPNTRRTWFSCGEAFSTLSRLSLTFDPSGLQGPMSTMKAMNGLGRLLQLAGNVTHLKLAFHPYCSGASKFAINFHEVLHGFTFPYLTDFTLEGASCEGVDLREFLARHGNTLRRLRLGGRGLAKPYEVSLGGIHLYEGTFKSLFTSLHIRLPKLEKLHLEGIFECERPDQAHHETYNFYPLTNENWEEVPRPSWVRISRGIIDSAAFERYVLTGGTYPGNAMVLQH